MKKLTTLFLLLTLVACGPAAVVPPTVAPSPSSTPAPPTATSTSAPTPTSTPAALTERCTEILTAFPADKVPPGTLVLDVLDGLSLLNFNQQTQRTISGLIYGVGTSPDGKWLSYSVSTSDNQELFIESADGQMQTKLSLDLDWIIFDSILWLDNKRLWFPVWNGVNKDPQTLVLNPFTGERQILLPDYPDFAPFVFFVGSSSLRLHFGYSNVVYDPSLRFVVYPQLDEDGYEFVLWDRETGQGLAKIPDTGFYHRLPLWFLDGNAFVVVAKPDRNGSEEWLMVNRDGEIRQLTHFGDLYPQFEFGLYASLSPDGRYLAFGLSHEHDPDLYSLKDLIILNLQTLEAVNTCVSFDYPAPVWSPDSQYLAVQAYINKLHSVVVLDVEQEWAVKVSNGIKTIPGGWLDSGE
jgi:hypothetical protein